MAQIWLRSEPLILASKSQARAALLKRCGIPFLAMQSNVDERAIDADMAAQGLGPQAAALALAKAKALDVSAKMPDAVVLAGDQTLALSARTFSKPSSRAEAKAQLEALAGHSHDLFSGAAVALGGQTLFSVVEHATLKMRRFSGEFLSAYLDICDQSVLSSVGAYQVEGFGSHLFEQIDGEQSTIMGMPLLPLLAFFRRQGYILA